MKDPGITAKEAAEAMQQLAATAALTADVMADAVRSISKLWQYLGPRGLTTDLGVKLTK